MLVALTIAGIVIALLAFKVFYDGPRDKPMPNKFPGPKQIPYFGNIVGMPIYGAVFQFKLWTDKYGPISEIKLLGQRFLLISSEKITKDLFITKGNIISGRPNTFAVKDAQSKLGASEYLPLMSFNEDHHRHKRVGRGVMTRSHANKNLDIPMLEAQRAMILLGMACEEPSTSWIRLTEDLTSRVTASVCFGSPKYAKRLHKYTWELLIWVSPNGVLSNLVIFLDKLPFWLSPWKIAEYFRHKRQQNWFVEIMEETRKEMIEGTAAPSFFRDHLEDSSQSYKDDEDAAKAIGMIATAGIFTVSGPVQNVVRALVCFPEWQKILHEEMDKIVEFPNMPILADLPQLPLLRCFLREVIRWRQAIPSGIPHEAEEDYMYNGVLITKGTGIFALEYGMSRDPEVYSDPYTFNPYRWINDESLRKGEDLDKFPTLAGTPMFGWGRRYCMGHELAQDVIHSFALNIIWSFNISTPDDKILEANLLPGEKKGGHQWPTAREQSLIIMRPQAIRVKFEPRGVDRIRVLNENYRKLKLVNLLSPFETTRDEPDAAAIESLIIAGLKGRRTC